MNTKQCVWNRIPMCMEQKGGGKSWEEPRENTSFKVKLMNLEAKFDYIH